jgi:Protein of unknown function (DUF2934)
VARAARRKGMNMAKAPKKTSTTRPRAARRAAGETGSTTEAAGSGPGLDRDPQAAVDRASEATPHDGRMLSHPEDPAPREWQDGYNVPHRDGMVDTELSDDEVARRAYEIYVSRGQEPGRHVEDWLQARRELEALRGRDPAA